MDDRRSRSSSRLLITTTKHEWIDGEKIPATGGCVVAMNHVSHIDPLTLGWLLYEHGRLVRYLAKDALFETPVIKHIVRDAKQIPVSRLTTDAARAFDAACEAVRAGECVGCLPRGHDHQGPQRLADARQDRRRPDRPGDRVPGHADRSVGRPGDPAGVLLEVPRVPAPHGALQGRRPGRPSDLVGQPITNDVLQEATKRIMVAITGLVADLRGETPPAVRFDPRAAGVRQIGNPKKAAREADGRNTRKRRRA